MRGYRTAAKLALTGASLAASSTAHAQADVGQPLPNVLLLVDSSGSMEYMPDGTLPAVCDPTQPSDLNRWGTLLTVLTGTIQNRGCYQEDRGGASFISEFSLSGIEPYDGHYFLPYHRYTSNNCLATPGTQSANVFDWSSDPIAYRPYNDPSGSCPSTDFAQSSDGILDTYRDRVRFGMFSFDPHADAGTGVSGTSLAAQSGMDGLWSYYLGWQSGGTPASGNPPDCASQTFEVGARNFGAPPWEGRMVPHGDPAADLSQVRFLNARIQEGLVAMRPYGATPLAAMLADAYTFFREDTSNHPINTSQPFAPAGDPFVQEGCRENFIIVLSDGEPNLDLRPYCENGDGNCPYAKAHEYAKQLATPASGYDPVKVFAVGFGLSSGSGFDCTTLSIPGDLQPGGSCDGASGSLAACCELSRVAYEGGTERAYFADDITTLKSAIAQVLDQVADQTTSRTMPAFSTATATQAANTDAPAVAYEFNTSFAPRPGELWSGKLERKRWVCETVNGSLQPVLQPVENSSGDDFAENVNDGKLVKKRNFYTVVGDTVNGAVKSRISIRPNLSNDDGLGLYGGTFVNGDNVAIAGQMQSQPTAMEMSPMPPECTADNLQASSDSDCAKRVMKWHLGGSNGSNLPSRAGNEFGAVYHSTPAIADAPRAFIRDQAYERFASLNRTRPMMLYTATIDGQLHAFKVTPNDATDTEKSDSLANNELWSFLPPHTLPGIFGQYPGASQILLDGRPVVKDVPLSRSLTEAQASGSSSGADYRTILVAGGYLGGGFYYALDVTDPDSPEFLWQVSSNTNGEPLFGHVSGTPAIATVSVKDGGTIKDTAVAILPGGEGVLTSTGCSQGRESTSFNHIDSSFTPRSSVRCWDEGPGRSLTIVRLDNGRILRNFRGKSGDGPSGVPGSLIETVPFDSPIVGTPVPYPNQEGEVANRIYVGDADGTLWRINMADRDPKNWEVHMAFDGYPATYDGPEDGQPIVTSPTLSVDGQGSTVIVFSTGDQEDFTSTTTRTRAWSLTESPEVVGTVPFKIDVNWVLGDPTANSAFEAGEKVTGPIALFDGVAYFSTFTPPPSGGASCTVGVGRVWGVDYITPDASSLGPKPEERLPDGAGGFVYNELLGENVTPFGVAVTAEPSCIEEAVVSDDYVGQHTTITQSVPPVFKLRFQTGASGDKDVGSQTNTGEIALPSPRRQTLIDSWASVVE